MLANLEQNKVYNENLLDEIHFALQERTEPTVVMMSVPDYNLQVRLKERLKSKLPAYSFYDINLTPLQVVSLHQTLQKELPQYIVDSERVSYCVNVLGLENSRLTSENGQIIDSGLIAQLNFEREIIFRKPNYITILWGDHEFFVQIQRKAPDLWSWVTNFFVFKQDEVYEEKALSPAPTQTPAKLPVREEYINSLKDKLEHLPLNDPDKGRGMKERLNLYSLLANEYANYFDYDQAKEYYENAIGLSNKLNINGYNLNKLLFEYGQLNLDFRKFDKSLSLYTEVLQKCSDEKDLENIGNTYHQIGMVYQNQRIWDKALENYQEAIKWKEKTGQGHELGGTFHQIGMNYEEQRIWDKALENYQEAIKWHEETGQEHELGGTYHQIGRVYEEQRIWDKALENYQEAIKWKEKTGQEHLLGSTYHHIGRVYEEQRIWDKALENYHEAINWYEKTGQVHELGGTFHQIGMVYEEQRIGDKALENYQKAIEWKEKTGQEHELGGTYHQIGRVYQEQKIWDKALENYQEAIEWKEKTEQEHELGITYHQIGRVHEEQEKHSLALENYEKSFSLMPDYFESEREMVNRSIERVQGKMVSQNP